jgi:hypothetical protein
MAILNSGIIHLSFFPLSGAKMLNLIKKRLNG